MKIRPFNIDKMRRHAARSTPDYFILYIPRYDMVDGTVTMRDIEKILGQWKKKILVKHARCAEHGYTIRIDLFQDYDIDFNRDRFGASIRKIHYKVKETL